MIVRDITRGVGLIGVVVGALALHGFAASPGAELPAISSANRGHAESRRNEPRTRRLLCAVLSILVALSSGFLAVAHALESERRVGAALSASSLFAASVLARPAGSLQRTALGSALLGVLAWAVWF